MKLTSNIIIYFCIITLNSCIYQEEQSFAYGNFEATEVVIAAEASGKLVSLNIQEGTHVPQGASVGLIDTTQLFLKKKQLLAQRAATATKAGHIIAQVSIQEESKSGLRTEKERLLLLLQDSAATQQQLDAVQVKMNVIDRTIESIKTQNSTLFNELSIYDIQLEQLNDQLNKCYLVNPFNGTVLEKYAEEKEIAMMGKPLYKLADLTSMYLRVYVSGNQLSEIRIGQAVKVIIDGADNEELPLSGHVSWVSPQAEFTPKTIQTKEERVNMVYAVKIAVKNDGSIKIGMPGEIRL